MNVIARQTKPLVSRTEAFNFLKSFMGVTRYTKPHYRNSYDYTDLLQQCTNTNSIKKLHAQIIFSGLHQNPFVASKLVAKYVELSDSSMEDARKVFDELTERDEFVWNVAIQGYANVGPFAEAIKMSNAMRVSGLPPNRYTYPFVLKACGAMRDGKQGKVVHGQIVKAGLELQVFVGNALVALYSKCGEVEVSRRVFEELPKKDLVSWNSMISGYIANGYPNEGVEVFRAMLQDDGACLPEHATLVCVLPACVEASSVEVGHAGMVAKGLEIFDKMEEYGVEKNEKHYACIVDLLGRAGLLDRAVKFIESMPIQAGKDVYGALLGACRIHNNIELAEETAEKLFVLDPENAGRYILLASMYEDAGRWEDAARVRRLIREKNIKKPTGRSSIEVECIYHTFGADDESHPYTDQIFDTLERLDRIMEEAIIMV
ncbi:hypothetical protein ACLB2K_023417 [Fragaria x ananassa]